jgi:hypothetical protein
MKQSWEQLEGESDKAFSAFVIFRDMGPSKRSLDGASTLYHNHNRQEGDKKEMAGAKNKNRSGQVQVWADRWNWRQRASAWDAEQDRVGREAQLQEIIEMRRRHAEEAMLLQTVALEKLRAIDPDSLTANQTLDYLVEAAKLERLSRGEPEVIGEQRVTGKDGGPVRFSMEETVAAERELEEWRRDRPQRNGSLPLPAGGTQVP